MTNITPYTHEYFMKEAIKEALLALEKNEVPVGAVVVWNNRIIGRGHNMTETLNDPTAHAEMQAITAATNYIGGKYLSECTLYVTLEPCVMCAGACYWAQLGTIVFGASDLKRGCSQKGMLFHPKTILHQGILATETSKLLVDFFKKKR